MRINKIGLDYTHSESFSISRPTGSGDYLLLLIKSPALVTIQEHEISVGKNTLIIYRKGSPQYYRADRCNYINDYIHFDAEEGELPNVPLDTVIILPYVDQVIKIVQDIYLEFISANENRDESMELLLRLLLVKVKELTANKPKDTILFNYYDALLNLRSLIYRHPEEKWTVERMAHEINLSPSHFQRLYKKTFGTTCIADVIACKMDYAKASLASTSQTVREISSLCGYENEEHFMRQFKLEVGFTPSQYRRLSKN